MDETGVRRLIWTGAMGIHDEVPGEKAGRILSAYRKCAKVIEQSEERVGQLGQHDMAMPAVERPPLETVSPSSVLSSWYCCSMAHR